MLWFLTAQLFAQTNAPVKLALLAETDEASPAVDILTATLSGNGKVQLLERDEIEKVYHEQGISVANRDDLKLGRILGADGLLLLETVKEDTNQFLNVRLVAVKPGVVLFAEKFPWPMKDTVGWSQLFEKRLDFFFPKLAVLAKDAIPISVVNLRSAISSEEASDTERQLKMLTIQRLSHEPRLFVLERQQMGLLSEEKELKSDESAFWDGSYLLDGIVDQNGYSRETITINARLTPPKGAAPLLFEISGSRTNLAEVVNRLAAKVTELLKVNSTVKEWSAQKEAEQYDEEAKWALKWEIYPEARAAADSAWALGKHDMDCAIVRISAYENPPNIVPFASGEGGYDDYFASDVDDADKSSRDSFIRFIKDVYTNNAGAVFAFERHGITYIAVAKPPHPQALDRITQTLNMYREFSESLSADDLKSNSAWSQLGVDVLTTAAETLQLYYLVPKSQEGAVEKLADLRALARWIDGWVLRSSPAHENIFRCELNWGCFWQENPENCIALYRDLLASNAFTINWNSDAEFGRERGVGLERPRVIAWQEQDRNRIPDVWDGFGQELIDSTNAFLHEEGKKFEAIHNLTGLNEQEVIAQYKEYWNDIQTAKIGIKPPEKQNAGRKWDLTLAINEVVRTDSTPAQAQELKPLLATYKSNLIRLMQSKSGSARRNLKLAIAGVTEYQAMVESKISPEAAKRNAAPAPPTDPVENGQKTAQNVLLVQKYLPVPYENFPRDEQVFEKSKKWAPRIVGSRWCEGKLVLDLRYHCEMHVDGGGADTTKAGATIFNPSSGNWETILYRPVAYEDGYPKWPYDGVSLGIFQGNFYTVENEEPLLKGNFVGFKGQMLKYDFETQQWEVLKVSDGKNYEFFSVNGHLYAANGAVIIEITDDGEATHILASTRRRPALSALDSLDTLGSPILFSGLSNSLCACIGSNTYCWNGTDWRKLFTLNISQPPEVFEDAVVFRNWTWDRVNNPAMIWLWDKNSNHAPDLALYEPPKVRRPNPYRQSPDVPTGKPIWNLSMDEALMRSAVTSYKSNLYFFVHHNDVMGADGFYTAMEKDGYHAELVCLSRDLAEPIVVPLKFDVQQAPLKGTAPGENALDWLHFAGNDLYIGQKDSLGNIHSLGFWAIPVSEIESVIQSQKEILLARMPLKQDARTQINSPPAQQ